LTSDRIDPGADSDSPSARVRAVSTSSHRGSGSLAWPPESPQVAVAIGGPTTDAALRAYESIDGRAGIAELRLDLFTERPQLQRLIANRPCPIVVTCRASVEGGMFRGSDEERLDLLRQAASLGAELVDVERFAFDQLGSVSPARVIVSQHDFDSMPVDLNARWAEIRSLEPDVVKVAGMALEPVDMLPVLNVLNQADVPTIAMAMGSAGVASRILALRYRCSLLTYASLDIDSGTAPGQISLTEMHQAYNVANISPSTRVFGLVATTIESRLIATYNGLLRDEQADAVCVPIPTSEPNLDLLRRLAMFGFDGFHVHGTGQQMLQAAAIAGNVESDSSDGLNSVSVAHGQMTCAHVSTPVEQVQKWLASFG
jgi:3-dehydroquinate dehydratase type I